MEKYGFRKITFKWAVVKMVLNISIYMMLQYLLSIVTWLMFFVFIENYLGERPLAVTNIVRSLYTIVTIPSHALGSAVNTMVSNTIGAGRQNEVLNLIKRVAIISLFSMLAIILIVAIAPRLMIHIYTNDASLINDTVVPLYVLLTSLPFYAVGTVLFSSVSGTGNTQRALVYEIITLSGYVFYTWFIIVYLRLSVSWAWTTEHVYWGQLMLFSLFYLRSKKWVHKKI